MRSRSLSGCFGISAALSLVTLPRLLLVDPVRCVRAQDGCTARLRLCECAVCEWCVRATHKLVHASLIGREHRHTCVCVCVCASM